MMQRQTNSLSYFKNERLDLHALGQDPAAGSF